MFEVSRRTISVNKHEETSISHHNSLFTLCADKHLHMLQFSYNLQCLDKQLDFNESSLPCPKASASSKYIKGYVSSRNEMKNMELTEMITNSYLWPYSDHLSEELTSIMAYEWSPTNLIYNNQSVLAILNSVGNLHFFIRQNKSWINIFDFSSNLKKFLISKSLIPPAVQDKISFDNLKEIVYFVSTSAICWSPTLNEDKSSYLVTAQKNGCIFFWQIIVEETNVNIKNVGKIQTDECEITTMKWIPHANSTFSLVYSNVCGEMTVKICSIHNKVLSELSSHVIWSYKDKMIPKHILYTILNDRIIFVFEKHRHLIVQMFDNKFKLLSKVIKNVDDDRITALAKGKNHIYIGTVNSKIYKVIFLITNKTVDVSLEQIVLKESYVNHELYGIAFSENDTICNITMCDRKVLFRKEQLKLLIISLSFEEEIESYMSLLLNNPTSKLTQYWDCIEFLRYKAMKTKKLPSLDYVSLYKEGETDIYKIKIYLILLKMYINLDEILKNLSKGMLPETSLDVVHMRILVLNASRRLHEIYNKIKSDVIPTAIELDSLHGCKKFINYYCKKYEKPLTDFITNDILNEINSFHLKLQQDCVEKLVCSFCDDVIDDFVCNSGHLNMFCVLTYTLIKDNNYLVCQCCNVTASFELRELEPTCPFCDSYMNCYSIIY